VYRDRAAANGKKQKTSKKSIPPGKKLRQGLLRPKVADAPACPAKGEGRGGEGEGEAGKYLDNGWRNQKNGVQGGDIIIKTQEEITRKKENPIKSIRVKNLWRGVA